MLITVCIEGYGRPEDGGQCVQCDDGFYSNERETKPASAVTLRRPLPTGAVLTSNSVVSVLISRKENKTSVSCNVTDVTENIDVQQCGKCSVTETTENMGSADAQ